MYGDTLVRESQNSRSRSWPLAFVVLAVATVSLAAEPLDQLGGATIGQPFAKSGFQCEDKLCRKGVDLEGQPGVLEIETCGELAWKTTFQVEYFVSAHQTSLGPGQFIGDNKAGEGAWKILFEAMMAQGWTLRNEVEGWMGWGDGVEVRRAFLDHSDGHTRVLSAWRDKSLHKVSVRPFVKSEACSN
ncbi:MAG: hypothetical protein HN348_00295 [Proteobacteria bacterium]|jgi:hypothetical protein|nr:hypothetical protein [Pseudomonadota bacterium]